MTTYKVRIYTATALGFFTQADHYEDFHLESSEQLEEIAQRLAREGFAANDHKWIMPGAILTVEVGTKQ